MDVLLGVSRHLMNRNHSGYANHMMLKVSQISSIQATPSRLITCLNACHNKDLRANSCSYFFDSEMECFTLLLSLVSVLSSACTWAKICACSSRGVSALSGRNYTRPSASRLLCPRSADHSRKIAWWLSKYCLKGLPQPCKPLQNLVYILSLKSLKDHNGISRTQSVFPYKRTCSSEAFFFHRCHGKPIYSTMLEETSFAKRVPSSLAMFTILFATGTQLQQRVRDETV